MWKMGPAPRQKNHDTSMDGLAIVIRGNKATKNVSTGDLVLVENSTISGVSDGGYKALSSVSAGTAFTSANLSALSKGAVNALSDQIANMPKTVSLSIPSNINNTDGYAYWGIASLNVSDVSKIKNITVTLKVSGNATPNHGVGWNNTTFFIFIEKGGSISRNDVTAEATIFFT